MKLSAGSQFSANLIMYKLVINPEKKKKKKKKKKILGK